MYPPLQRSPEIAEVLEQAVQSLPSVDGARGNPLTGSLLIAYSAQDGRSHEEVEASLISFLSRFVPLATRKKKREERRHSFLSQMLSVAATGGIVFFLYLKKLLMGTSALSRSSTIFNLSSVTAIIAGVPIFRSGLAALTGTKKANVDTLISAATFASLLLRESLAGLVVVWLINLSTLIQELTVDRSRREIQKLLQLEEDFAWVKRNGDLQRVRAFEVRRGEEVLVHTGEKITVDGEIVKGEACLNQAPVTGESVPVYRKTGDPVFAGTLVSEGMLEVRALHVGEETSLMRIAKLVEMATTKKSPVEHLADSFSDRVVPVSFFFSLLIFLLTGSIQRTMTVLVTFCPCAVGLATPTAITAGIGHAARRGVLVKGGDYLEQAGKVQVAIFDKTGTLTSGLPEVSEVNSLAPELSQEEILSLAASLAHHSTHPFSTAVTEKAKSLGLPVLQPEGLQTIIGHGIRGRIDDGEILLGSQHFMEENALSVSGKTKTVASSLRDRGNTVLFLSKGERILGIIGVRDELKKEATEVVRLLQREGNTVVLLTGDEPQTAKAIADSLNLDQFYASVHPEEKVKIIKKYQGMEKVVAMIGDGINDAPAIAHAHVGIALATGGAQAAIEASHVAITGGSLWKVPFLFRLSRETLQLIRENFILAVAMNSVSLVLGIFGILSPLSATLLHNLATLLVVLNSGKLLFSSGKGGLYVANDRKTE